MRLLSLVLVLAVTLSSFARAQSPAFSKLKSTIEASTGNTMSLMSADKGKARLVAANGTGYKLLSGAAREDKNMVSSAVKVWLGRFGEEVLGIGAGVELREYETRRVEELWQTSFEVLYDGIPVRERYVKVNTGVLSGSVLMVRSQIPHGKPNASKPNLPLEDLQRSILADVRAQFSQITGGALVYLDQGSSLTLAYELVAGSSLPERYRLTYDALTGKLLEKKSMLTDRCFENHGIGEEAANHESERISGRLIAQIPQAVGSGRVTALVHPNMPTDQIVEVGLAGIDVTINGTKTITDSLGFWSLPSVTYPLIVKTGLQNAYLAVRPDGLTVKSILDTILTGPANIQWNDDNSTQSERDAMYSLLRTRAYIKSIEPDLKNIDQLLRANVDYNSTCNAFYDPDAREFTFFSASTTCNAMAQVSDVVYHEYGHRVNHCRYLNSSTQNMQDPSLNEGFADVYSALMRDDPRIGRGFFTNASRVLRNIENTRKWPTHISGDPHESGLIVAGAFWDLRKATDLATAERLFHEMSQLTPDGPGGIDAESLRDAFTNVLVATILADDDDNDLGNGTPNLEDIIKSFEKHNITLAALLSVEVAQIPDQNVDASGYQLQVTAGYNGPVGALDESSVTAYYSTDGSEFTALPLIKSTGDLYEGTIPKVVAGTVVRYYASGANTLGDTNISPLPSSPLKFLVGFKQTFFDDFETNKGWSKDDSASTGRWERGEPFGTSFQGAENYFVQQDTDHTVIGTMCYVTGNQNTSVPSVDDVDNGVTMLTSPVLDFSKARDPYIRLWYNYSNDLGQNPGSMRFVIEMSTDGTDWEEVFQTKTSTNGWEQLLLSVKDYQALTSTAHVRFIAKDTIGSLVEAAIDDFEVLDPVEQVGGSVADGSPDQGIRLYFYPQPLKASQLHVRVVSETPSTVLISLKDVLGKEHSRLTVTTAQPEQEIALPVSADLPNGIYILEATSERGTASEKLIISR